MSTGTEKIEEFLGTQGPVDEEVAAFMLKLVREDKAYWTWDPHHYDVAGLVRREDEKFLAILFLEEYDLETSAEFDAMLEAEGQK